MPHFMALLLALTLIQLMPTGYSFKRALSKKRRSGSPAGRQTYDNAFAADIDAIDAKAVKAYSKMIDSVLSAVKVSQVGLDDVLEEIERSIPAASTTGNQQNLKTYFWGAPFFHVFWGCLGVKKGAPQK